MSKTVPFLLVVLLVGIGWQVLETSNLRDDLRRLDEDATTLQATVGILERRVRELDGREPTAALRREVAGGIGKQP